MRTPKVVLTDKQTALLLRRLRIKPGQPEQERWCIFVACLGAFLSALHLSEAGYTHHDIRMSSSHPGPFLLHHNASG